MRTATAFRTRSIRLLTEMVLALTMMILQTCNNYQAKTTGLMLLCLDYAVIYQMLHNPNRMHALQPLWHLLAQRHLLQHRRLSFRVSFMFLW